MSRLTSGVIAMALSVTGCVEKPMSASEDQPFPGAAPASTHGGYYIRTDGTSALFVTPENLRQQLLLYDGATGRTISYSFPEQIWIWPDSAEVSADGERIAVVVDDRSRPPSIISAPRNQLVVMNRQGRILWQPASTSRTFAYPRFTRHGTLLYWSDLSHLDGWGPKNNPDVLPLSIYSLFELDVDANAERGILTAIQNVGNLRADDACAAQSKDLLPLALVSAQPFWLDPSAPNIAVVQSEKFTPMRLACSGGAVTAVGPISQIDRTSYIQVGLRETRDSSELARPADISVEPGIDALLGFNALGEAIWLDRKFTAAGVDVDLMIGRNNLSLSPVLTSLLAKPETYVSVDGVGSVLAAIGKPEGAASGVLGFLVNLDSGAERAIPLGQEHIQTVNVVIEPQ